MTRSFRPSLWLFLVTTLSCGGAGAPARNDLIQPNDNRAPAGKLENGVLTVALEARNGVWQPEGAQGKTIDSLAAVGEAGKPLSTPGPILRVPVGTKVQGSFKNTLGRQLTVFGLGKTRGMSDSMVVAAGQSADFSFTADTPGTYYYLARGQVDPFLGRLGQDTQLGGAIVVDRPNPEPDRVFVISWFFTLDSASKTGLGRGTMAINGLSWPHTERLTYAQNDSIHWRVINLTEIDHPMHLHGFYFRVNAHGSGVVDSIYTRDQERMAVTEIVAPFTTLALSWDADRPGNWIYHCHYAAHLSNVVALDMQSGMLDTTGFHQHSSDRPHQMFGLVMGITVAPKGAPVALAEPDRKIRIEQREKPGIYGEQPGMSFVMDGTPEAADSAAMPVPGPALILERGKPVQVTIVNRSTDHAAVHWHGIELESYPDGVPGWSGSGKNILPSINPGDSLMVRWTPPRSGSFMYHSHFSEAKQMGSGLYGPIIVLEPGEKYDPETDRVLFFGTGGTVQNVIAGPFPPYVLNGSPAPKPMDLKAGTRYRFRLFNLAGDTPTMVSLNQGQQPVMWRAVAKDGYPLPESQAVTKPAVVVFDPGEIYDFEFTPTKSGELNLSFGFPSFLLPPPPPPGAPPGPPLPFPKTVAVAVHVK